MDQAHTAAVGKGHAQWKNGISLKLITDFTDFKKDFTDYGQYGFLKYFLPTNNE